MVSTRLSSPCNAIGLSPSDRRNRVDPAKLIGLIHRIKAASGAVHTSLPPAKPTPVAKAG